MSSIQKRQRSSPYPLSRLSAPFAPIDQTAAVEEASRILGTIAHARLKSIQQQILRLQEEAQQIIANAEEDVRLHTAVCGFTKKPGQIYHLYHRGPSENDNYFSLLSPEEWGIAPHPYIGSYKLENDFSWTRVESDGSRYTETITTLQLEK